MCIIVMKKSGVAMPNTKTLSNCWESNSDGAGLMYRGTDNKIYIRKGFLNKKEFFKFIKEQKFTKDDNVIFHFRIKTHGKVNGANTHPFPVTSSLSDLKEECIETPMGIAHNGTISKYGDKNHSDTMLFVKDYLSKPKIYKGILDKDIKIIKAITKELGTSRLALMTPNDTIKLGRGWIEKDGIVYSNRGFEKRNFSWARNYGTVWSRENSDGYSMEVKEKCFIYALTVDIMKELARGEKLALSPNLTQKFLPEVDHIKLVKAINEIYFRQSYRMALTQAGVNLFKYNTPTKVKNSFKNTVEKGWYYRY